MKNIILSFDDGLEDFYYNAFPILKKYGIKATLNVITGFSDKSVESDYKCCSIEQIKEMVEYGIEIANHSNDHICPEPLNGYDLAQIKLTSWFPGVKIYGVATPFAQKIPSGFFDWCKKNNVDYVRLGDIDYIHKYQRLLVKKRIVSHFRIYCYNNSHYRRNKGVKVIYSIPIYSNKSVDYYKKVIDICSLNPKITFMFHSIVATEDDYMSVPYPDGAWTKDNFEELIAWILQKGYAISRQCDTI